MKNCVFLITLFSLITGVFLSPHQEARANFDIIVEYDLLKRQLDRYNYNTYMEGGCTIQPTSESEFNKLFNKCNCNNSELFKAFSTSERIKECLMLSVITRDQLEDLNCERNQYKAMIYEPETRAVYARSMAKTLSEICKPPSTDDPTKKDSIFKARFMNLWNSSDPYMNQLYTRYISPTGSAHEICNQGEGAIYKALMNEMGLGKVENSFNGALQKMNERAEYMKSIAQEISSSLIASNGKDITCDRYEKSPSHKAYMESLVRSGNIYRYFNDPSKNYGNVFNGMICQLDRDYKSGPDLTSARASLWSGMLSLPLAASGGIALGISRLAATSRAGLVSESVMTNIFGAVMLTTTVLDAPISMTLLSEAISTCTSPRIQTLKYGACHGLKESNVQLAQNEVAQSDCVMDLVMGTLSTAGSLYNLKAYGEGWKRFQQLAKGSNAALSASNEIGAPLRVLDTSPVLPDSRLTGYIRRFAEKTRDASFEIENIFIKLWNDDPEIGKAATDRATKMFQRLFIENLEKESIFKGKDISLYADWKSVRGIFDSSVSDNVIKSALQRAIEKSRAQWLNNLKLEEPELYALLKKKNLADPNQIFKAGFSPKGGSPDETSLVTRMARKIQKPLVTMEEVKAELQGIRQSVADARLELSTNGAASSYFKPPHQSGSEELFATLRKFSDDNTVLKILNNKKDVPLTLEDVKKLRQYYNNIDLFSPSIPPSLPQSKIDIETLQDGTAVFVDIRGQGARNAMQTATDLLGHQNSSISELSAVLRQGEQKATQSMQGLIDHTLKAAQQIDPGAKLIRSGDDITLVFTQPLSPVQKDLLLSKLARKTTVSTTPGYFRVSYPQVNSRSAVVIPETIQKELSTNLALKPVKGIGNLDDLIISVEVQARNGKKEINLIVAGKQLSEATKSILNERLRQVIVNLKSKKEFKDLAPGIVEIIDSVPRTKFYDLRYIESLSA